MAKLIGYKCWINPGGQRKASIGMTAVISNTMFHICRFKCRFPLLVKHVCVEIWTTLTIEENETFFKPRGVAVKYFLRRQSQ